MSLPYGLDLNNQIDIDKRATRLTATLHTLSTREMLAFERRVYDWMARNTPDILTLYVLFSRKDQGSVIKGIDGENLGSYHILKPRACT